MQLKELRDGNLAIFNKKIIKFDSVLDHTKCDDLKPILLTKKWLIKIGFSECEIWAESHYVFPFGEQEYMHNRQLIAALALYNDDSDETETEIYLITDCNFGELCLPIDKISELSEKEQHDRDINYHGNYVNLRHIKYVHQLQNLYFSLTGTDFCFLYN